MFVKKTFNGFHFKIVHVTPYTFRSLDKNY